MPNNSANNSLNHLPDLINKLVKEHEEYQKKSSDLSSEIDTHKKSIDTQRKIILSVLSDDNVTDEDLNTQKPELRNLVRDYINIRKKLNDLGEQLRSFKRETEDKFESNRSHIKRLENYVKNYSSESLDEELPEDLDSLAKSIDSFVKNRVDESVSDVVNRIRKSLKGDKESLPSDLEKAVNEMIIERLEEFLEPYEKSAYRLTHNEISQEEFIEHLKKKALIEQMRSKIIADITHTINQRNISEQTLPIDLKKAIDNLIRDQVNYALLTKDKFKQ